jgi:hypothetical protein
LAGTLLLVLYTHGKDWCSRRARHEHQSLPWVMDINPEIRERILNPEQQLFEASGRLELPTVDVVRQLSRITGKRS